MNRLAYLFVVLLAPACGGFAPDSEPGGDGPASSVGTGGIAVDPRTENIFALRGAISGTAQNDVYAIAPDSGQITPLIALAPQADVRVLFPRNSVMVIAEPGAGTTQLARFDANTLAMTNKATTTAQFWGTRTSPTGTYVAVGDSSTQEVPIDVIEADTLAIHPLPYAGQELEALWLRNSDELAVIVFDQPADTIGNARILVWSMPDLMTSGFVPASDGVGWANPIVNITVPNVGFDFFFSYTFIAVSPDDHYAVFPVQTANDGHELLVLDLTTKSLRTVDNALGPVGFTPDSSTIVSYRAQQLLFVDVQTLQTTPFAVPEGLPNYFVTREGSYVVIAPTDFESGSLTIYDYATQKSETVGTTTMDLDNFVSRVGHDELWLVENQGLAGELYRLNFVTGALDQIQLAWNPRDINILPTRDRLVLDDTASGSVRLYDPHGHDHDVAGHAASGSGNAVDHDPERARAARYSRLAKMATGQRGRDEPVTLRAGPAAGRIWAAG